MTQYERKFINRNYLIRVYYGKKIKLIGGGMLEVWLEPIELKKLIKKLLDPRTGNYTYWNRKDLKIKFIQK